MVKKLPLSIKVELQSTGLSAVDRYENLPDRARFRLYSA
jgi:hypothetical protein